MKVSYIDIILTVGQPAVKIPFYWGSHATSRFMESSGRSLESILTDGFNMSDVLSIIEIGIEEGQNMAPNALETPLLMTGSIAGRMIDTNKYLASRVMKIVADSSESVHLNLDIDPDLVDDKKVGSKKKKRRN